MAEHPVSVDRDRVCRAECCGCTAWIQCCTILVPVSWVWIEYRYYISMYELKLVGYLCVGIAALGAQLQLGRARTCRAWWGASVGRHPPRSRLNFVLLPDPNISMKTWDTGIPIFSPLICKDRPSHHPIEPKFSWGDGWESFRTRVVEVGQYPLGKKLRPQASLTIAVEVPGLDVELEQSKSLFSHLIRRSSYQ